MYRSDPDGRRKDFRRTHQRHALPEIARELAPAESLVRRTVSGLVLAFLVAVVAVAIGSRVFAPDPIIRGTGVVLRPGGAGVQGVAEPRDRIGEARAALARSLDVDGERAERVEVARAELEWALSNLEASLSSGGAEVGAMTVSPAAGSGWTARLRVGERDGRRVRIGDSAAVTMAGRKGGGPMTLKGLVTGVEPLRPESEPARSPLSRAGQGFVVHVRLQLPDPADGERVELLPAEDAVVAISTRAISAWELWKSDVSARLVRR